MKILGIDYGEKRVGIASTDDAGEFALPRSVYPNDEGLLGRIVAFIKKNGIKRVVIGESRDLKGNANPVFSKSQVLGSELQKAGYEVVFHPEFYTSMEADRLQGQTPMRDASAAALILKSYIDTLNNQR